MTKAPIAASIMGNLPLVEVGDIYDVPYSSVSIKV